MRALEGVSGRPDTGRNEIVPGPQAGLVQVTVAGLGVGAVAQTAAVTARMARAAMTGPMPPSDHGVSRAWHSSRPKQSSRLEVLFDGRVSPAARIGLVFGGLALGRVAVVKGQLFRPRIRGGSSN